MHLATSIGLMYHFFQSFCWMLIHSLWQGLLLALVTVLVLMMFRNIKSSVRYNLVFIQFFFFLLACGLTFIYEWNIPSNHILPHSQMPVAAIHSGVLTAIPIVGFREFAFSCLNYFSTNAPMVVLIWFVLFLFRAIKMMGSLVYLHRAKQYLIYEAPEEWTIKLDILGQKLQLKKAIRLVESGFVKMPMVIGHLKPLVLVPVGLLTGLPAGQVEAVLLHELAHIRRNDWLVNFLQTIAESVFFFNPGLLWISSLLRDERENCCDDIALDQTKNKQEFIEALVSFKEQSLYGAKYQVAFPGGKNHLLNRVSRIITNQHKSITSAEKSFFIGGLLLFLFIVATLAIADKQGFANRPKESMAVVTIARMEKKAAVEKKAIKTEVNGRLIASRQITESIRTAAYSTELRNRGSVTPSPEPLYQSSATLSPENPYQGSASQYLLVLRDSLNKLKADLKTAENDLFLTVNVQTDLQKQQEQEKIRKDRFFVQVKDLQVQKNIEQEVRNEQQVRRNAEQVIRNEQQAKMNAEQAKRNEMQMIRNEAQAKRNAEQTVRNEQQARQNELQERRNSGRNY